MNHMGMKQNRKLVKKVCILALLVIMGISPCTQTWAANSTKEIVIREYYSPDQYNEGLAIKIKD